MSRPTTANATRFLARFVVPSLLAGCTIAVLAYSSWHAFERVPPAAVTPVAVIESASSRTAAGDGIQAPGWIEPAPYAVEVRALRSGIVTEMLALEGSRVESGDVLARLERGSETIALARQDAALRLAEADVEAKSAAMRAAERTLELALDAERAVRDAEAALREAEGAQGRISAEVAEAEANESEARDEHDRKSRLVEIGAASAGEVRRHGIRVAALAAKSESLRQERTGREARVVAARGDLEAARKARAELVAETRARDEAKAALAGAEAAREVAVAMRDEARLALDRSEVRAPRAGVVMQRIAAPGARVDDEGEPLLLLYDPASLQVRCDVPLKDAARLAIGLEAEIRVDALPEQVFRGKVARIVPQGDIQKNTVQCKVVVESPDAALRPDMLARVRILARGEGSRGEAVAVPAEALRSRDGDRATVLVAAPDGAASRAALRGVTLGDARANGWIEVADGLAAGDRVVLDAALEEGARFSPVERPKEEAP